MSLKYYFWEYESFDGEQLQAEIIRIRNKNQTKSNHSTMTHSELLSRKQDMEEDLIRMKVIAAVLKARAAKAEGRLADAGTKLSQFLEELSKSDDFK